VRVVRANKVRQAVSLWKAVQTATWRQDEGQSDNGSPPYQSFIEQHRPNLRFHYRAIAHLLDQVMRDEAAWDAFFEHTQIKPTLVLYENFASDYVESTLHLLARLNLDAPEDLELEPKMKKQSDGINDDWTRRFSELRLGTQFDLVPAVPDPA
jgi:LPS sulfotransferase NodH